MRPATRMMMLSSLSGDERPESRRYQGNQNTGRQDWEDPRMEGGYEPPRGRDDYERRSPTRSGWENEMDDEPESRRMDGPRGRRPEGRRYDAPRQRRGGMYSGREDPMGFDMSAEEGGGEDEWSGRFRGVSVDDEPEAHGQKEPDEEKLKSWVKGMKNADGTTGEHFKEDHTNLMRANHCPGCDKTEFYAAVNMMYSDYCEVAKRMGVDNPDFYACMAKAFLMDKDAGKGKIGKYMKHVAGK